MIGKCHLCDKMKELRESHVWPAFAYKRFAADQSKGGRFADLSKQRLSNEQYTLPWFCSDCEQILSATENYAARLCTRIDNDPTGQHDYDENLLRFATSISWRTLKFYLAAEEGARSTREDAYSHWKRYLRGTRTGINPYTQHVYVIVNNVHGLDKALGGQVFPEQHLVLSQIGPLFIVGLLNPDRFSADDQITWRNSKIRSTGGTISPVKLWKTGEGNPKAHNITLAFARLLYGHEVTIYQKVVSGKWQGRQKV